MLSHCNICCLHATRNKNLHELRSSIWLADEQIPFSWRDTSSNGLKVSIKDKLVNEPKAKFTWLKQNMWLLCGEVRFSKLITIFEFHLVFNSDWFRTHKGHPLPWQQSGFRGWFCCPTPKHTTSSSSPPSLQVYAWDHGLKRAHVKTLLLQASSLSSLCERGSTPLLLTTAFYTHHLLWKWWGLMHSLS